MGAVGVPPDPSEMRPVVILRSALLCLALTVLGACSSAPLPAESPAARYDDGGAAVLTGAYDFGLF
jgi:hypothetical protein